MALITGEELTAQFEFEVDKTDKGHLLEFRTVQRLVNCFPFFQRFLYIVDQKCWFLYTPQGFYVRLEAETLHMFMYALLKFCGQELCVQSRDISSLVSCLK